MTEDAIMEYIYRLDNACMYIYTHIRTHMHGRPNEEEFLPPNLGDRGIRWSQVRIWTSQFSKPGRVKPII